MDYKRAEEFAKHIEEIQRQIGFGRYLEVIQDKIIDYAAKNPGADLEEIRNELLKVFPPEYKKYIDEVFVKYNSVLETANELYDDMGPALTRQVTELRAMERVDRFRYGQYEDRTIKRITKVVHEVLLDEPDRRTLERKLITEIKSERVTQYADTIAWTQVKAYGRAIKNIKANIAEIFFYDYYGPLRETTRKKCLWALAKKTFSVEEIAEQDNDKWNGQIKPFMIYCGGWNCAHDLEPNPFIKRTI